jgi:hypothetical protein
VGAQARDRPTWEHSSGSRDRVLQIDIHVVSPGTSIDVPLCMLLDGSHGSLHWAGVDTEIISARRARAS